MTFSIARRFSDGGRQHRPPLAPPLQGGERLVAPPSKLGEAWRTIPAGKSALGPVQLFHSPPNHLRGYKRMSQSPGIVGRYRQLVQEMLINSVYQDRAIDPWSHPTFDTFTVTHPEP